jgi:Fur family transcriptional regulator, ferric uptake regulator
MKSVKQSLYDEVKGVFTGYLKQLGYRKTLGRYDILKEIYFMDSHFEVEELYLNLKKKNYHISRATIYNTVELLLQCGLIVKHSFGNKAGSYEKAYGENKHDHLICLNCNDAIEFEEVLINEIINKIGAQYKHQISHYSFTLYGNPIVDKEGRCSYCKKEIKSKK